MAIHITSKTKLLRPRPKTRDELIGLILWELERQGMDADLNFIDTSEITNMKQLFGGLNVGKIKIEWWDVSNVKDMSHMFYNCTNFNCDLSRWNVYNVKNMNFMFTHCHKLNCNLSQWRPNVDEVICTFTDCILMTPDLLPHFNDDTKITLYDYTYYVKDEITSGTTYVERRT